MQRIRNVSRRFEDLKVLRRDRYSSRRRWGRGDRHPQFVDTTAMQSNYQLTESAERGSSMTDLEILEYGVLQISEKKVQ